MAFSFSPLRSSVLPVLLSMYFLSLLVSLLGLASASQVSFAQSNVDAYIASESVAAKAGVLANIGPSGAKCQGAKAGVVIASPSQTNPDYVFTWTRDSSLVFKMLIDQYTLGIDSSASLRTMIDQFVAAEAVIQQTSNPSGSVSTGGLGEPKFNIDQTAFTGPWGRPQRDGPALRSTALVTYANWLIKNSNSSFVTSNLWPMIKLDLDYVATNWNFSTFDLWEEVDSSSFFTVAVQHRALREGISLANTLGMTSSVGAYTTQANNLLCFLQSFWHSTGSMPFMTANTGGGRSGVDANTVLASVHTFDPEAGCDANTFQPCSDRALANLLAYTQSFRSVYSLNSNLAGTAALATGRYPEDVYMGGNPWYLATFAVAEQLYDALQVWTTQGSLEVTSLSQPFFAVFDSSIAPGTYSSASNAFTTLTSALKAYADAYITLAAKYTPSSGGLAEQYSRNDGSPLSAVDLTWSYASALTAFEAREGTKFASWGARGLTVPSQCETASGGGSGPTVAVTFNVDATTVPGENIYLTGSIDALKDWSPDNALLMSSANYPIWSVTVNIPVNTIVQYKYIRKNDGTVTWESDPNNQFTSGGSGSQTLQDTWR